jgi:hypothetical protein
LLVGRLTCSDPQIVICSPDRALVAVAVHTKIRARCRGFA